MLMYALLTPMVGMFALLWVDTVSHDRTTEVLHSLRAGIKRTMMMVRFHLPSIHH